MNLIIPALFMWLLAVAAWKRLPMYDLFVTGAREGVRVAFKVLPNLAGMLVAISLMRASGLMDALSAALAPVFGLIGLPEAVAPLTLIRPLSGSASLALLESVMLEHGADSRAGMLAGVLTGSGEAIFYIACVYTSSLKRKDTGYAIPCAIAGELAAVALAGLIIR